MAQGRRTGSDGDGSLAGLGGMISDAVLAQAGRLVRPRAPAEPRPPARRPPMPDDEPAAAADHAGGVLTGAAASVVARVAPAVIDRVDIDAVVERVDVDRVLARVDVNALLDRVAVDALLDRVDPDRLLDRVDVDRVVERVDIGTVAREAIDGIDLPDLIRESTVGLGGESVRDARLQAMRADRAVERTVDRILRHDPRGAVIAAPGSATSRAGIVSRVAALVVDSLVVVLACLGLLIVLASVRLLWLGRFDLDVIGVMGTRWGSLVVLLAYLTYGWGLDGRTVGNVLMGLRVLSEDGSDLSFGRALVRAAFCIVFPIGLLWSAVSARSASVQDLVVRTVVVHDWGGGRAPVRRPERRGEELR